MSQIRAIRPTTQEMEYTNHPLYYEKCIKIKASIVENFTPFDQKWKKIVSAIKQTNVIG